MNYISMIGDSTSDFYGISTVLAVSGCIHKCDGCWAKERGGWKYTSGTKFDDLAYEQFSYYISKPYCDNIVIQGGDSLIPHNFAETLDLCKRLKSEFKNKRIVIFTGYTFEEVNSDIIKKQILPFIDVLVDGKYEKSLPSATFRGSNNQRIIWLDNGEIIKIEH